MRVCSPYVPFLVLNSASLDGLQELSTTGRVVNLLGLGCSGTSFRWYVPSVNLVRMIRPVLVERLTFISPWRQIISPERLLPGGQVPHGGRPFGFGDRLTAQAVNFPTLD